MKQQLSSSRIKAEALRLGFDACGMSAAGPVAENNATAFRQWLEGGHEAEMGYMRNYEEKRLDPRLLVEGAQTVISVALNYYPEKKIPDNEYQIAWYAYGKDYHDVMKGKLNELFDFIKREYSRSESNHAPSLSGTETLQGRAFCDTAPVLERYWAYRSGLGWIGKNTQLIIPSAGSCFFLGELILNIEADHYDIPLKSHCGSCNRCVTACPTEAIEAPFKLNSERCISYLTIEHRGDFAVQTGLKTKNMIYGCDECLKACPWNRFATPCSTPEFKPSDSLLIMKKGDWQQLTEEQYKLLFKGSAVKRAKYSGLMRNIKAI